MVANRRSRGVTLVELVVSITLLAVAGIFIAGFLGKTTTQFVAEETKTRVTEEARTFLNLVKKDGQFAIDIRPENPVPSSPGSSVQTFREIVFTIRKSSPIQGEEPISSDKIYRTECVTAPVNTPPLPATQDCITCPAGQVPVVVSVDNGVTNRVFPAGSLEIFGRAFSGTLCPSRNPLLPGSTLTLVAHARLPQGRLHTYSLESSLPVPVSAGNDIQFIRKF